MNRATAAKIFDDWFDASQEVKSKTWDKVYPIITLYRDVWQERCVIQKRKLLEETSVKVLELETKGTD